MNALEKRFCEDVKLCIAKSLVVAFTKTPNDFMKLFMTEKRWGYVKNLKESITIGMPDFIVFPTNGITLFVECKSGKASLSTPQRHLKKQLEECNYRYLLYRDDTSLYKILTNTPC